MKEIEPKYEVEPGWKGLSLKHDKRPQRGWWAPGGYFQKCHSCGENFAGDKRSGTCADCAYAALILLDAAEAILALGYSKEREQHLRAAVVKSREVEEAWKRFQTQNHHS